MSQPKTKAIAVLADEALTILRNETQQDEASPEASCIIQADRLHQVAARLKAIVKIAGGSV